MINSSVYFEEDLKDYNKLRKQEFIREFEVLILAILDNIATSKGKKKLKRRPEFRYKSNERARIVRFDAMIEEGFDKIPDNTLIEVQSRYTPRTVHSVLRRIRFLDPEFRSLILILGEELSENDKDDLITRANRYRIRLDVWDYEKVFNLINNNEKISYKILNNIGKEVFNQTIENAKKSSDNWIQERDEKVEKLKKAYENDEIILMLGAGTSKDAGVPSWNELLKKLNLSIINQKYLINSQQLKKMKLLTNLLAYKMVHRW